MQTREGYIDPPGKYADHNHVQFHQGKQFVHTFARYLKGPVLDVGCGDGRLTAYIAKTFKVKIVGLDVSRERVQHANAHYANQDVSFVVGDACALAENAELKKLKFKTIMSFNALHHIPQDKQKDVFKASASLLDSDGKLLFMIPGKSKILHGAIQETIASSEWSAVFAKFDLKAVRTYQDLAYYHRQSSRLKLFTFVARADAQLGSEELDLPAFKQFMAGWLPHLAYLKTITESSAELLKLQDKLLQDIATRYFGKMQVALTEKVDVVVQQNSMVLGKGKQGLMKHVGNKLRSRL